MTTSDTDLRERPPRQARHAPRPREARPGARRTAATRPAAEPSSSASSTAWPTSRTGSGPSDSSRCSSSCRASMRPARTARSSRSWTAFNPQGCAVTSFKVPTPEELAHDFLWRIHKARPAQGRDRHLQPLALRGRAGRPRPRHRPRSGLVEALRPDQRVRADARPRTARRSSSSSCPSIATSSAQRFQARYDDPTKRWKFSTGRPRGAQALGRLPWPRSTTRCRRPRPTTAPWYVIPANRNWFRNLAVATILADTIASLKPHTRRSPRTSAGPRHRVGARPATCSPVSASCRRRTASRRRRG